MLGKPVPLWRAIFPLNLLFFLNHLFYKFVHITYNKYNHQNQYKLKIHKSCVYVSAECVYSDVTLKLEALTIVKI